VTDPVNHQPPPGDGTAPLGTALLTDHYELTMVQAALRSGAANRRAVFEVFARHLPHGRRYGVVAGSAVLAVLGSAGPAAGRDRWFTRSVTSGRLRSGRLIVVSTAPAEVDLPRSADKPVSDRPWVTIVWNDPVNLMSYVTYVFQHVFGYPKKKATKLMLDVHHKGRAVVAAGAREAMEHNVEILHGYGLWATVRHDK